MEKYTRTEMDVIRFQSEDVIITSPGSDDPPVTACTCNVFGFGGGGTGGGR